MKNIIFILGMTLITTMVVAQTSKTNHTTTESTMVTINNNDHNYSLTATYDSLKRETIHKLVTIAVGPANENYGRQSLWKSNGSYTVLLKPEKLVIDLDKDLASKELIQKFDRLGKEIEQALSVSVQKKGKS